MEVNRVDGWRRWLSLSVLPPICLICGERGDNGRDLCINCCAALPWNAAACERCALPLPHSGICGACQRKPPPLERTWAAFVYEFPVDRLVPRLKFHRDLAAGRVLAELMAESLSRVGVERPDALVPIPLHRARLRQRGYDQARELTTQLSRRMQLPMLDGLRRTRDTHAQSELDADARRRNLRDAFATVRELPAHVALIDDVMTTGATLHAAAKVLRRAGVKRIDAWVCARVP